MSKKYEKQQKIVQVSTEIERAVIKIFNLKNTIEYPKTSYVYRMLWEQRQGIQFSLSYHEGFLEVSELQTSRQTKNCWLCYITISIEWKHGLPWS